jgi:hypothetical protein
MRYLLMLAAAATLAACHNRGEDETGAAPDRGDTTAVTATDTTAVPTDTTMGQTPGAADTSFVQQDTTAAPTSVDTTATPTGDTTGYTPTDTSTSATPTDTSTSATPSDSSTMGDMGQEQHGCAHRQHQAVVRIALVVSRPHWLGPLLFARPGDRESRDVIYDLVRLIVACAH